MPATAEASAIQRYRDIRATLFDRGPVRVEAFAGILSEGDMRKIEAMVSTGMLMRAPDGRVFDPARCARA